MNDSKKPAPQQDACAPIDERRRRLTKGALATTVVLGTLVSRPVLGAAPYNCTISGQLSGNTSSHGKPVGCSTLGRSPGYWRQEHKDWPAPLIQGEGMIDGSFKPIAVPTGNEAEEGTRFTSAGFADALKVIETTTTKMVTTRKGRSKKTETITETRYDLRADTTSPGAATLLQVVAAEGNDGDLVSLGRAAVATLLNAYKFAPDFPLRPDQVVAMFNAVTASGGTYQVNASTFWNRAQVKVYFESLYA